MSNDIGVELSSSALANFRVVFVMRQSELLVGDPEVEGSGVSPTEGPSVGSDAIIGEG